MRVDPISNAIQSGYVSAISSEGQRRKKLRKMMKAENVSWSDMENVSVQEDANDMPASSKAPLDTEVNKRLVEAKGTYNQGMEEIAYTLKGAQIDKYS